MFAISNKKFLLRFKVIINIRSYDGIETFVRVKWDKVAQVVVNKGVVLQVRASGSGG